MCEQGLSEIADSQLDRIMELARRHLEMEVVLLSEFTGGRQVYRAATGDAGSFGVAIGTGPLLESTYCAQVVDGRLPSIVADSAQDDRVRDLQTTGEAGIGAYIGVPVTLPDGTLYGTFCGLSHSAQPDLHRRDVQLLRMLADLIADQLFQQREQQVLRDRINALITGEQVDLALQPVVAVPSGSCLGLEVLSRFPTDLGPPDRVFAAAHSVGLGLELELMVISKAVALLPSLPAGQVLGLNLSPAVLFELAAYPSVAHHPGLGQVMVEITEHEAVQNYAELRDRLQPLRERGLRLAIDDAGAGYASLHHIIELRPDVIKIDRSIVDGLSTDSARRSVVRTFVQLAQDLGAAVMAEGVENAADLAAAVELGVTAAQGYLFARPTTDHAHALRWAAEAGQGSAAED
jgi:EAL domain-containing protein (putative c-di-GMP-specific phosphodiesterase class I)